MLNVNLNLCLNMLIDCLTFALLPGALLTSKHTGSSDIMNCSTQGEDPPVANHAQQMRTNVPGRFATSSLGDNMPAAGMAAPLHRLPYVSLAQTHSVALGAGASAAPPSGCRCAPHGALQLSVLGFHACSYAGFEGAEVQGHELIGVSAPLCHLASSMMPQAQSKHAVHGVLMHTPKDAAS